MKILINILIAVVGMALAADPVTYDYSSNCEEYCADIGLSDGDAITGFIEFDSDLFSGSDRTDAVTAFTFTVGDMVFTLDNTEAFRITIGLSEDFTSVTNFNIRLAKSIDTSMQDHLVLLHSVAGISSGFVSGACLDVTCEGLQWNNNGVPLGPVASLSYRAASVPEPATWLVLMGGLIALFLNRRQGAKYETIDNTVVTGVRPMVHGRPAGI